MNKFAILCNVDNVVIAPPNCTVGALSFTLKSTVVVPLFVIGEPCLIVIVPPVLPVLADIVPVPLKPSLPVTVTAVTVPLYFSV
jgi:hypothetical protein